MGTQGGLRAGPAGLHRGRCPCFMCCVRCPLEGQVLFSVPRNAMVTVADVQRMPQIGDALTRASKTDHFENLGT